MRTPDDLQPEVSSSPAVAPLLGTIAGCVTYVITHVGLVAVPRYLPELGRWTFTPGPQDIAMGYFGQVAYGMLAFVLGTMLGRVPPLHAALRPRARVLTWLALAAVWGSLGYFLLGELPESTTRS